MGDPRKHLSNRLTVSEERWREAQAWEREVWFTASRKRLKGRLRFVLAATRLSEVFPFLQRWVGTGDDWNEWWSERFDRYRLIPQDIGSAIELGSGPFTNIRLIKEGRSIRKIVCSDPLIDEYIQLRGAWLAEAHRKQEILLDANPAESLPFADSSFDLVVLINVLDHVRDMPACVASAIRLTRPKGYLVLGQDLTSEGDSARIGDDLGHPIRMSDSDLDGLLLHRFEPSLHRVLPREEGRNPAAHYGTYLFIGNKRAQD